MDRSFWLNLWQRGRVPFHGRTAHPQLVEHLPALGLAAGARVFVPLCGHSVDIGWLRARGYRVAGAELSPLAVAALFDQMGERPGIAAAGALRHWRARDLDIYEGDIFDLDPATLGQVDAVYDRAALIALPADLRPRYAAQMTALAAGAPQLLLSFTGPEPSEAGPPFEIGEDEIRRLYGPTHGVTLLGEEADAEGYRDQVWKLDPLSQQSAG